MRLNRMPQQPGNFRTEFGYDYQGRRVEKRVYVRDPSNTIWELQSHTKYVWSGWLLLLELDGLNDDQWERKFTWGLDLAGQHGQVNSLDAAGGIGGLLAIRERFAAGQPSGDFGGFYDGNGNVGQVVKWTEPDPNTALLAHYECDPYGQVTNDLSGYAYAAENRWHFSTSGRHRLVGATYLPALPS